MTEDDKKYKNIELKLKSEILELSEENQGLMEEIYNKIPDDLRIINLEQKKEIKSIIKEARLNFIENSSAMRKLLSEKQSINLK